MLEQERPPIQLVYAALAADEARNAMIFNDVLQALEDKRSPVILTERKDHALLLAEKISRFARNVIVLTGGVGAKQRRAAMQRLGDVSATDERVLIATGR
jgi:superfamily II DNA/RNA helicase